MIKTYKQAKLDSIKKKIDKFLGDEPITIDENDIVEIIKIILTYRGAWKISALKVYRYLTGVSLRDSKEVIDIIAEG
jgi:ribosomal protein L7/L12